MDRADLLALCRVAGVSWNFVARESQRQPDLDVHRLLAGHATEESRAARETLELLTASRAEFRERRREVEEMIAVTAADGVRLTTVLDDDYPLNLRVIDNLPPFLFYRGELRPDDAYSVAVVGTRVPSSEGVSRARKMAGKLAEQGVTIVSGLARGIDAAAHEATLDAGGRTIAVLGSGIRRIYPHENTGLAERVAATGAVVSQFWPDTSPTSYTFPRRNVVTSGMSQGTVVVEASATSGAKMQARLAIEHGKQVFLLASLVTAREWAQNYLKKPRVYEVTDVDDIIRVLRSPEAMRSRAERRVQLALTLA
jgi:DNA processing protein